LSSAGKKTAQFPLAWACVSYIHCVNGVSYVPSVPYVSSITFLTDLTLRALHWLETPLKRETK